MFSSWVGSSNTPRRMREFRVSVCPVEYSHIIVLHRALPRGGSANLVVNPASIAVAANDKVKTDRRDSKKLARDLADGRLQGIYIPTEAEELARLLPRTRAQLVEHRATLARQIKAKLHQFGLITPKGHRMISHRYLQEIATWALP